MATRSAWLFMLVGPVWGCGADCGEGTRDEGGICERLGSAGSSCGEGTHEKNGKCVPDEQIECGPGTHLDEAACVVDNEEPKTTTWSKNLRVPEAGVHSFEPSVAADGDGHVYVAFMEASAQNEVSVGLFLSADEGAFFARVGSYPSKDGLSGDVTLAADADGNAYLGWIDYHTQDGEKKYSPSDVVLIATHDHGESFSDPISLNQDDGATFNDRPWLTVGADGLVHAKWIAAAQGYANLVYYARSTDGEEWSVPVDAVVGSEQVALGVTSFSGFAVRPDGSVWIPFWGYYPDYENQQYFPAVGNLTSEDGTTFGVEWVTEVFYTRYFDAQGFPQAAAASTGRICLAFYDAPERDVTVHMSIAEDGSSFETPFAVDDGGASTQIMPWVAADEAGGCHVMWLDNRTGNWDVRAATVAADGSLDAIEIVSDATFEEDGSFQMWLGDFNAIAVGGEMRYAVWTDTRDGQSAIYLSTSPVPPGL